MFALDQRGVRWDDTHPVARREEVPTEQAEKELAAWEAALDRLNAEPRERRRKNER